MIDNKPVSRKKNMYMCPLNVDSYKNFHKDFFLKYIKSLCFDKRSNCFTSGKRHVPKVTVMTS